MKIAIISDTHDNLVNFKKAIAFIKKENIKTIIHCGDVASPETLKAALKDFKGEVHVVFGNVDEGHFDNRKTYLEELPQVKIWGELGEIEIEGKKIAFLHFPQSAKSLAQSQQYDLVFYGHTHKPWERKVGNAKLVNPGNLAGLFFRPTFAIYDTKTDKLELKILEKL